MTLVELSARNLCRRPLRSCLAVLGIALAVASAIALIALAQSINRSAQQSVDERGSDITVMQRGVSDLFGGFLPEAMQPRLAAESDIRGVAGELVMFAPVEGNREILVVGWPQTSFFWRGLPLSAGRAPRANERHVVLLGDAVANALAKHLNDEIEIFGVGFRIVGITHYVSAVNRGLVIVPLVDLQEAAYRNGQVTLFHLSIVRGLSSTQIDALRRRIEALGPVSTSMTSEMLRDNRYLAMLNAVSLSTSAIAIVLGILNVLNTLIFTIQERTREIGILAAIGWADWLIAISIVMEGMILCILGCIAGVGLAFLASLLFGSIPVIGDYLSFRPTPALILPTVAAAVALCFVGSLYPAWRAIRLIPAKALQRA